jgi:prepilin-type processing-associated H-X9-DG protein
MPTLVCPAAYHDNPVSDRLLEEAGGNYGSPIGAEFALTDYVLSKGTNDAFCSAPGCLPREERGMFDYDLIVWEKDVKDGLSNTFAIGEGACGPRWSLCDDPGCREPNQSFVPHYSSGPYYARQLWLGSGNIDFLVYGFNYRTCGVFACTVDKLNKNPVTHFMFVRSADPAAGSGTLSNPANPHRVPNFRSDHSGGGNFLYGDGSVHFLSDGVDMPTYRAMSTSRSSDLIPTGSTE